MDLIHTPSKGINVSICTWSIEFATVCFAVSSLRVVEIPILLYTTILCNLKHLLTLCTSLTQARLAMLVQQAM